jgi:hypothetical protein
MTIREAHKTGVGPKIVFLFAGSWTRRKPHERGVDVDGEERRNMRQAAGGRAGARFSRPPEQPLAPEVASASSGHLGHTAAAAAGAATTTGAAAAVVAGAVYGAAAVVLGAATSGSLTLPSDGGFEAAQGAAVVQSAAATGGGAAAASPFL